MCRYDDDYAWMVESQDDTYIHPTDVRCEDCGRTVAAGEVLTHIVGDSSGGDMDERDLVFAIRIDHPQWWADPDDGDVTVIREEDVERWERLGYKVDEIRDPFDDTSNVVHFYWCAQCQLANHWLKEVCDQSIIGTVGEDLHEHLSEYDEETLGRSFVTMERMCSRQWRTDWGALAAPSLVKILAREAVEHAVTVGLHP